MGENHMRENPIGVFDSGVGGLTVAREIINQLPNENIVYFGDTARVPYGSKSKETIIGYSRQIAQFLRTKEVKAIVIACNTASALALETLKQENDIPVLGVVEPGARAAAKATKNNKIGVIGTLATVNSGIYSQCLRKIKPEAQVYSRACPLFVPLVEENWLYRHTIQKVMGEEVELVNPAYETALKLKAVLEEKQMNRLDWEPTEHRFYVSDGAEKFKAFANTILPCDVMEADVVNIEQY